MSQETWVLVIGFGIVNFILFWLALYARSIDWELRQARGLLEAVCTKLQEAKSA